ncbi:toll/interleukin-1 receptor domain-containing protein [Halobacillus litoralis]|uniref:toll/interleukin-1 receptor domain-containing protein n=1 Tax=Halobacillus litoralis TaxID=45668 RepID=UPI00136F6B57|nr:toll/interleukin-1 receptor domain-containing protein [Halobacillus litoralis]MYL39803.1 TIR domain-containing protein [Halobacillus litoralis]
MAEETTPDKVFLSYTWSSPEHEEWVDELAHRLEGNGVPVVYDKWDNKEGQDLNKFMESTVNDISIKKVLVICNIAYEEKANGRKGGVGTETLIISPEVYDDAEQTKFVPIIAERKSDGSAPLPTYLKGKHYIDMSSQQAYEAGYEKLLRNLYGKPEYKRPKRGTAPSFLTDEEEESPLESRFELRSFKHRADKNGSKVDVYFRDFLEKFKRDFSSFSISTESHVSGDKLPELILEKLESTTALRDVFIEALETYVRKADHVETDVLIEFLESLYPIIYTRDNQDTFYEAQFDHMKLFVNELVIYIVGVLYNYNERSAIKEIIKNYYFVTDHLKRDIEGYIGLFASYPRFIEQMQLSAGQNYISTSGELLRRRASHPSLSSEQIVEMDFLIYFVSFIHNKQVSFDSWSPKTYPYFNSNNIGFMRKLKSRRFFEMTKELFGARNIPEMKSVIQEFKEHIKEQTPGGRTMFIREAIIDEDDVARF